MTDDMNDSVRQLTTSTAISIGLMITLLIGTILAGRYLQKIDTVEEEVFALRAEMRQVRNVLTNEFRATRGDRDERNERRLDPDRR